MKIGFQKVLINPKVPVFRMKQKIKHQTCADDLFCRILMIEHQESIYFLLSIDTVEVHRSFYDRVKNVIESSISKPVNLILSATHSHNCPCLTTDIHYQSYVLDCINEAIPLLELEEEELSYTCKYIKFQQLGCSRIEGKYSDNVYAEVFSIWSDNKRLGSILMHNAHPTIEALWKYDFTSEYPGAIIRNLQKVYPDEFFMYMMGPSGDISSRYLRHDQSHKEMLRLADLLSDCYQKLMGYATRKKALSDIHYEMIEFEITREYKDLHKITMDQIRNIEEKKLIEKILSEPSMDLKNLPSKQLISCLLLGEYHFLFVPFELFSSYYACIFDKDNCSLVTVTNGYDEYVCDEQEESISFEWAKETVSIETKKRLKKQLNEWSKL